jgi:hypothetical protein
VTGPSRPGLASGIRFALPLLHRHPVWLPPARGERIALVESAEMSNDLLVNHCRLVTRDLDEARECLTRLWERHKSQLRGGRTFGIRWHQADLAHTAISHVRNSGHFSVQCDPVSDVFRIIMPEYGRIRRWTNGREAVSTASSAGLQLPGRKLRLEVEPSRITILMLRGDFVEKALATRFRSAAPLDKWPIEFPLQSTTLRCAALAHPLDRV